MSAVVTIARSPGDGLLPSICSTMAQPRVASLSSVKKGVGVRLRVLAAIRRASSFVLRHSVGGSAASRFAFKKDVRHLKPFASLTTRQVLLAPSRPIRRPKGLRHDAEKNGSGVRRERRLFSVAAGHRTEEGTRSARNRRRNLTHYLGARANQSSANQYGDTSLRPAMPATIKPMQKSRATLASSPSRTIPSTAVPIVPMPVQTA